jgi:hypothetical protein
VAAVVSPDNPSEVSPVHSLRVTVVVTAAAAAAAAASRREVLHLQFMHWLWLLSSTQAGPYQHMRSGLMVAPKMHVLKGTAHDRQTSCSRQNDWRKTWRAPKQDIN